MWKISDVKKRGRESFKKSYWKSVLIALILAFLLGGSAGSSAGGSFASMTSSYSYRTNTESEVSEEDVSSEDDSEEIIADTGEEDTSSDYTEFRDKLVNMDEKESTAVIITFIVVVMIITLIILAVAAVLDIFIMNPLEMGCRRYFYKNLDEDAPISNVVYAFDHNFKNIAKVLFYKDMYTILWSMLFVIPGIVKAYEYMMIPYLLAENPDMSKEEAFAESKRMMKGNKWKAFLLDLSFIGWNILSLVFCGIPGIFYVAPYIYSTNAALYETLRYGKIDVE